VGWTVQLYLADRPPVHRGPSARFMGELGGTRCSGANNGPFAPGCRTVRGCVADCPRVPRAGGTGVAGCKVKQAVLFFSNATKAPSLHLSLALSQEKAPSLGISFGALPGPSGHIPGLSTRFSTMSSGYFFRISHSLSRILSKKVIRV
jgi:hypothetical protein